MVQTLAVHEDLHPGEALGIIQQLLGPSPSKGKSRSKIQHAIGKNENYD